MIRPAFAIWARRLIAAALAIACFAYLIPKRIAEQAVRGGRPDLALAVDPKSADAAGRLAERSFAEKRFEEAAAYAGHALRSNVLNLRALSIAGMLADRNRDEAAPFIFQAAGRLSWRNTQTQLWLLAYAAINRDYANMMNHADALYRRDKFQLEVLNVVAQSITDPAAHDAIIEKFATNPALRQSVLRRIGDSDKALFQYAFPFLDRLARNGRPADAGELGPFMRTLVGAGNEEAAFRLWRTRPDAARDPAARNGGLLYDGNFLNGGAQSSPPFQWIARDDPRVETFWNSPNLDGVGRGLLIQLEKGLPIDVLEQTMMLAPGRYRLSGQVQHDDNGAPRIKISCLRSGRKLADYEENRTGFTGVRGFSTRFVVPSGCRPQRITIGNGLSGSSVVAASYWLGALDLRPI